MPRHLKRSVNGFSYVALPDEIRGAVSATCAVVVSAPGAEEEPLGSTSRFAQHGRTRHARQTRDHHTVSTQRDARSWDVILAHLHIGSFLHQAPRVRLRRPRRTRRPSPLRSHWMCLYSVHGPHMLRIPMTKIVIGLST